MIAFDTNFLIRLLTNDDPAQCRKVTQIIDAHSQPNSIYISNIVMAEIEWVLDYTYGLARDRIAHALAKILEIDQFNFSDKELLSRALAKYRASKGDFSDCIIGEEGKAVSAVTYSFDKQLKNDPNFIIAKS